MFKPQEISKSGISTINEERNSWMEYLMDCGVATRPSTHAVHMLDFYKTKYRLVSEEFPCSHVANDCSISLPLFHGMSENEQEHVIQAVLGSKV